MSNDKLDALFERSITRRRRLLEDFKAVRLVDGIGDGIEDIFVDKFAHCAVVHIHREHIDNESLEFFSQTSRWETCGVTDVYVRQRGKDAAQNAQHLPGAIMGDARTPVRIEEHGVSYLIDPMRHINAGFFIDMRDIRGRLKSASSGKRVLNLFCYSGSLGISAFAGGAREVTQVDISKGILSWAKENFEVNQALHPSGVMRVIPEDSKIFLEREKRRIERGAERYDTIIIDPPSFSRSKQGTFKVERDLVEIVLMALEVVASRAEVFVTTNLSSVHPQHLIDEIRNGCGTMVEKAIFEELLPPTDFSSPLGSSIAMRGIHLRLP